MTTVNSRTRDDRFVVHDYPYYDGKLRCLAHGHKRSECPKYDFRFHWFKDQRRPGDHREYVGGYIRCTCGAIANFACWWWEQRTRRKTLIEMFGDNNGESDSLHGEVPVLRQEACQHDAEEARIHHAPSLGRFALGEAEQQA